MMSLILAKVLGVYFIAVGIGLVFHPESFKMLYKDFADNRAALFLGGMFALFFGAFVVSVHNVWVLDWPLIVTIVGWLSLIKGALLIAYPDFSKFFSFFYEMQGNFYRILGCVWGVLGLILLYNSCQ